MDKIESSIFFFHQYFFKLRFCFSVKTNFFSLGHSFIHSLIIFININSLNLIVKLLLPSTLQWRSGKERACQCIRHKRCGFNPWVGTISWRRKWKPTPVFFSGKFHGQRSLVGYSPGVRKELGAPSQFRAAYSSSAQSHAPSDYTPLLSPLPPSAPQPTADSTTGVTLAPFPSQHPPTVIFVSFS